jgi:hypothetical protein
LFIPHSFLPFASSVIDIHGWWICIHFNDVATAIKESIESTPLINRMT